MILMNYPEAFIFAMLSTMAFGIIFQAPRRSLPLCGLVGAVGWLVSVSYTHLTLPTICSV